MKTRGLFAVVSLSLSMLHCAAPTSSGEGSDSTAASAEAALSADAPTIVATAEGIALNVKLDATDARWPSGMPLDVDGVTLSGKLQGDPGTSSALKLEATWLSHGRMTATTRAAIVDDGTGNPQVSFHGSTASGRLLEKVEMQAFALGAAAVVASAKADDAVSSSGRLGVRMAAAAGADCATRMTQLVAAMTAAVIQGYQAYSTCQEHGVATTNCGVAVANALAASTYAAWMAATYYCSCTAAPDPRFCTAVNLVPAVPPPAPAGGGGLVPVPGGKLPASFEDSAAPAVE